MDGTIADTSLGIFNSIRYTEEKMGLHEITYEQMYSHIGPPMEESYSRNFGLTGDELKQAVKYHKEYAMQQGYKELKIYDGMLTLVDELRKSGVKTAVATLKAHTTIIKIFESLGISDKFDEISGVQEKKPKTKEQLVEGCLKALHIDKTDAVLIGDSRYDAIGAEQVGIDFIAVTYGFGFKNADDANEYKNVGVFNSVRMLGDFLMARK